ncbi:hypothetical protein PF005_g30435 [Phytophthora fragariae]|nr:hypothetical protein PF009_g29001 [Phytophthora fragariae]KAE8955081.1 hypothetical protein PF011_g31902 [Phytophthora fragariae]KAE9074298.1 hypothetical protein PF006_g28572 [Phytophthora fragariae]KAE9163460.1 hypothetical protein PF005_g30435 [Phytophthora fragariae]KAE9165137.1 hypothetical protein PF004_g29597 [Phytophthora fragariae]
MYRQDMLRSLGHNMKDPFYEYFDANWEHARKSGSIIFATTFPT